MQPGSLESEAGINCMTFDMSGSRLITGEVDKTIKRESEPSAMHCIGVKEHQKGETLEIGHCAGPFCSCCVLLAHPGFEMAHAIIKQNSVAEQLLDTK